MADVETGDHDGTAFRPNATYIDDKDPAHTTATMSVHRECVLNNVIIMTYGSEAWYFKDEVRRKINGVNRQMVSVITGSTQKQEITEASRTFNLVRSIRAW